MGETSKLQTNFTAERPPWNYEAVLDAFRAGGQEGATFANPNAADDVVQSVPEYAGRANLARAVVNFMRNVDVLVSGEDNSLVFFDPARTVAAMAVGSPAMAATAPTVVAAGAVASTPDAYPASDVESTPLPPPKVVERPRKKARITPTEETIIAELRGMSEVTSLFTFLRTRFGGDGRAAQATHFAFTRQFKILVSVRKGEIATRTSSLHRVDHAALDALEFVVDPTLARAHTSSGAAVKTTAKPAAKRSPAPVPARATQRPKKAARDRARPTNDSVEGIRRHMSELVATRQRSLADAKKAHAALTSRLAELNTELVRVRRELDAAHADATRYVAELKKLNELRKALKTL